jgi:hypothetical protein
VLQNYHCLTNKTGPHLCTRVKVGGTEDSVLMLPFVMMSYVFIFMFSDRKDKDKNTGLKGKEHFQNLICLFLCV